MLRQKYIWRFAGFETNFALKSSVLIKRKVTVHKGWEQKKESWCFNQCVNGEMGYGLTFCIPSELIFFWVTQPPKEVITQSVTTSFAKFRLKYCKSILHKTGNALSKLSKTKKDSEKSKRETFLMMKIIMN